ncbi:MAG: hypothetical protein R3Y38_05865 [Rikenellaceae bacterium]
MIKKIFFSTFFFLISLNITAQNQEEFVAKLSLADSLTHASAIVIKHSNTADYITQTESAVNSELSIYRINIFFDNSQNAREDALKTKEKFSELFPDIPCYLNYENPYFKITVGNCTSSQEAIILQGKLTKEFPKSFLTRERVEIKTMLD